MLNILGIAATEEDLIREIGCTQNGTDTVEWIVDRCLKKRVPQADYRSIWLPQDPPTQQQVEDLWRNISNSINAGYPCIVNFDAPESNHPRGTRGSGTPNYRGHIYHYCAATAIADDGPGGRHIGIADPGFSCPDGSHFYWCSLEQVGTLIPPHGYAAAFAVPQSVVSPPPVSDAVSVVEDAFGRGVPRERYAQLLPALQAAVIQAELTNVKRLAMWFAQIGHESGGLKWMEELADGSAYEGRRDLGNTQPGDGRRFKGHGPIQITGRSNHSAVSVWAHNKGFVPTADYFVQHPEELGSDRYGFLGAVWYWTVARPNINSMCDGGDLEGVTRAINGGLNGLDDRRARYNNALRMGDRLLALVPRVTTQPAAFPPKPPVTPPDRPGYKSISPYRTPGEGAIGGLEVFAISDDGMLHGAWVEYSAMILGDQESIARVVRSAAGKGADTSPAFVTRARRVLAKVPRDDLAAVLARVAVLDPDWIEALRSS